MRALSSLPLDDDVVDQILTYCATFDALESILLVSKQFHRTFKTHPNSIIRSVTFNMFGSALPAALRIVRYPYPSDRNQALALGTGMALTCPEEAPSAIVLLPNEIRQLLDLSKTIAKLEDIYSVTHKDRSYNTSVLTPSESQKFRRAAYRLMLFCNLFPGSHYDYEESEEMDDQTLNAIMDQRAAVLDVYSDAELKEIYAVAEGMRVLSTWWEPDDSDELLVNTTDVTFAAGPVALVDYWHTHSLSKASELFQNDLMDYDYEEPSRLYTQYFAKPLKHVLDKRGILTSKSNASRFVLDSTVGGDDTCSQCDTSGGLRLFTKTTWGHLSFYPFPALLRGGLKLDFAIVSAVSNSISLSSPRIFAIVAADPETEAAWAKAKWDVSMSYCNTCLRNYIEEHSWKWYLKQRLEEGWIPPEDCWYGYDCKTQRHQHHANSRNHLCKPTRS
ncbi:F-box domain-containing protein [Mycena kentingensis (nom. inval.)]|nr:F-box domain-containing protein [Mycena kentingensis (nom. inval.)]